MARLGICNGMPWHRPWHATAYDLEGPDNDTNVPTDETSHPDPFLDDNPTQEELFSIHLLKLVRELKAPLYAYRKIMDLVTDVTKAKVEISPKLRERDTAIKYFTKRYKLQSLYPTTVTRRMFGRTYPIVIHQAKAMIESLLYSSLMNEDNMLFPNMDDPLAPPPEVI